MKALLAAVLLVSAAALVDVRIESPAVEVAGVDGTRAPDRQWQVSLGFRDLRDATSLVQPQSIVAIVLGLMIGAASMATSRGARIISACAGVVLLLAATITLPLDQSIRMGDYGTYVAGRSNFEAYFAGPSIRFEAHLSSMLLRLFDRALGADERSPVLAFHDLGLYASMWYCSMMLVAAWALGWTPSALRYLAIVTTAPATIMFFGFHELGYLSLNAAAFPLIVTGLRRASTRFDAGSALVGVGAALHGFGLLSLVGTAVLSLAARIRLRDRVAFVMRAFGYGTSAYLIWIFLYVTVMRLNVLPGHAGEVFWRPLWESRFAEHRINAALLSFQGAAETLVAGWLSGAVLLLVAVVMLRQRPRDVALAVAFTLPSLAFQWLFWPIQGLAVEGDLIFGAFPALFALAWLAARTSAATCWSLALLAGAHVIFWRVMLGDFFVNSRVY
jgi:hypothetical protein